MNRFIVSVGLLALSFWIASSTRSADDTKVKENDPSRSKATGLARLIGDLDEAFKRMSPDGAKVSKAVFIKSLGEAPSKLRPEVAARIFDSADTDKDGFVSLEEFKKFRQGGAESPEKTASELVKPLVPRSWKSGSVMSASELDRLLVDHIKADNFSVAPLINDEQFIRRVSIDLTGKLPTASDVDAFLSSSEPNKRARLIDRLLDSDDFGRHWGRFWRDVMSSKASATKLSFELHRLVNLEDWLASQLNANQSWADTTRALLTAQGILEVSGPSKNGGVGFLLCHDGVEAAAPRAADTARVFLGIQIECAQCHDHPTDIWKREQFHELAAYFARTKDAPKQDGPNRVLAIISQEKGEHQMPAKDNPKQTTTIHPRFFLTNAALPHGKSDQERRQALADLITGKENKCFPMAFVNRTWGQLMGQSFVQPVDGLGPAQQPIYPEVFERLAAAFRASDFNIKAFFSTVLNSQTYQRQVRLDNSTTGHLRFSGKYPVRVRGDVMWDTLTDALGPFAERTKRPMGLGGALERVSNPDYQTRFKRLFDYDPSSSAEDVEGSVPQVLFLMNNRNLNARMKATGDTVLACILKTTSKDDEAVRQLFLQTLSRRPSEREIEELLAYVQDVGSRAEAFEDVLWVLVNSTEFRTNIDDSLRNEEA